jgi:hypothetical protein
MSLDDVKKKYRSQSQLYEAFRIFSEEMEQRLNDARENLRKVQENLSRTGAELRSVQNDRTKVADEVAKRRQERDHLKGELRDMTKKRDKRCLEVKRLEKKGYTPGIIKKLKLVDARSGPELLSRVQTAEKHDQLTGEIGGLEKRSGDLNDEIKALEVQKKSIEQQTISKGNVLDELKRKTASFKETVETVDSVLKEGYHPRDLKSMALGLKAVGIKGDPAGSVIRLVEGLEDVKSLEVLEEKLRRTKDELADTSRARDQAKDELAVASALTSKAIEEARARGKQGIAAVGEQERNERLQMAHKFESRTDESIRKFDVKIQELTERQRVELKDVAELEHRKVEVEQVLGPGLALARALKSPEELKTVPASFIMQLLERIQSWSELNMPDALVRPTEAIRATDWSLLPINKYKPVALIELLKEGLKQFMIQQGKKEPQRLRGAGEGSSRQA